MVVNEKGQLVSSKALSTPKDFTSGLVPPCSPPRSIPKEEVQRVVLTSLAHAFARVMSIEEPVSGLQ